MPKTIGNRKKDIVREVALGDKHHLRKSSDRKAQLSPVSGTNAFLLCAFRSEGFLKWCLSTECNRTHNLFFLFPKVFGINLIHFSMRKTTVHPTVQPLVSVLRSPVKPFDRGKTIAKSANFTKNANCFEECSVFGNGKCEIRPI